MLAIEGMNGMVPDIPEDDSAFWNEVLSVPAILLKIKNRISDAVANALTSVLACGIPKEAISSWL